MAEARLGFFLALGVIASVLLAGGLLMMKSRSAALPPAGGRGAFRAIARWLRDPMWLGGLAVQLVGYALYMVALGAAPVSLVAVVMQGGVALFVVFAVIFLHERAGGIEWIAIGAITTAMLLLSWSLTSGAVQGSIDARALALLSAAAFGAGLAPAAAPALRRSGAALAIASGIAFGLGSIYTKALTGVFEAAAGGTRIFEIAACPWLYLAIVANLGGLVLLQNSFHWARGIIAMPLSSACSNIVPIVGGIAAFGERLPADNTAAAMRVGAFTLTIAAGALMAAAPAHSSTDGITQEV